MNPRPPRVLVDTHVWLWMLTDPGRLPSRAGHLLADSDTEVLLSAASSWEIAIKYKLGKLPLPEPPISYVPSRIAASGVVGVAVEHAHTLAAGALPLHHRDPFDRLLIAQAQALRVSLVSRDSAFESYDIEILWE